MRKPEALGREGSGFPAGPGVCRGGGEPRGPSPGGGCCRRLPRGSGRAAPRRRRRRPRPGRPFVAERRGWQPGGSPLARLPPAGRAASPAPPPDGAGGEGGAARRRPGPAAAAMGRREERRWPRRLALLALLWLHARGEPGRGGAAGRLREGVRRRGEAGWGWSWGGFGLRAGVWVPPGCSERRGGRCCRRRHGGRAAAGAACSRGAQPETARPARQEDFQSDCLNLNPPLGIWSGLGLTLCFVTSVSSTPVNSERGLGSNCRLKTRCAACGGRAGLFVLQFSQESVMLIIRENAAFAHQAAKI